MNRKGDAISQRICDLRKDLKALRSMTQTDPSGALEVELSCHPAEQMGIVKGDWTKTPFPGVRVMGVSISENEVIVVCEVEKRMRFQRHTHGPWSEHLVLSEGSIYEHSTGHTYTEGSVYYQPAGVWHEPEFMGPGRCMITWRRCG